MAKDEKTLEAQAGLAADEVAELAGLMAGTGLSAFKDDIEARYRVLATYAAALIIVRDLRAVIEHAGDDLLLDHMEKLGEKIPPIFAPAGTKAEG